MATHGQAKRAVWGMVVHCLELGVLDIYADGLLVVGEDSKVRFIVVTPIFRLDCPQPDSPSCANRYWHSEAASSRVIKWRRWGKSLGLIPLQ